MSIFIDETALISLMNPDKQEFKGIREAFNTALNNKEKLFTHNIAVGLALSRIKESHGADIAVKMSEIIDDAYMGTYLHILWIGRRNQKEALRLFKAHRELGLCLYDFSAYIFMKRRRISTILTTKTDFNQMGMKVIPEQGV